MEKVPMLKATIYTLSMLARDVDKWSEALIMGEMSTTPMTEEP